MEDVTVEFVNGNIVSFVAQEFDVDLKVRRRAHQRVPLQGCPRPGLFHTPPAESSGGRLPDEELGGRRALDTLLRSPPALTIQQASLKGLGAPGAPAR